MNLADALQLPRTVEGDPERRYAFGYFEDYSFIMVGIANARQYSACDWPIRLTVYSTYHPDDSRWLSVGFESIPHALVCADALLAQFLQENDLTFTAEQHEKWT